MISVISACVKANGNAIIFALLSNGVDFVYSPG